MNKALALALILPASLVLTGCKDPPPEDFGVVMIELQRSAGEATDPFQGTRIITAFLDYEAKCLAPFYTTDHPEYQQDGIEGAEVFEEWGPGGVLCGSDYAKATPDCSIGEGGINQVIDTQGAQDITRLIIDYQIGDDDIEGTHLPFGPLPTEHLAGCSPLVKLTGASVQGKDGSENGIWQIASFENATARVGQGASIQIFVESSD